MTRPRCPKCIAHPGWKHDDESRRTLADYCMPCLGSGVDQDVVRLEKEADEAYDHEDQSWFDNLSTHSLLALWAICCDIDEGASYDDEVYDALAKRGHWDAA